MNKTIKELLEFGIINIDKPTGPTSFWTSQYVKNALGLRKTSHLGTLDPMVTGVLPVALNRACRLNEYLMHRDKTYVGVIRVHKEISIEDLQKIANEFLGKITQMPPVRSSVKRAERVREIKTFQILEKKGKDFLFISQVQAGTYIRKLCSDMGEKIEGAHMLELRRTQAGIFNESTAVTLYDFDKAVEAYKQGDESLLRKMIVPGEIVAQLLPIIKIRKDVVKKVFTGSPIFSSFLEEPPSKDLVKGDKVAVFAGTQFIGCYNFIGSDELIAKAEFVLN